MYTMRRGFGDRGLGVLPSPKDLGIEDTSYPYFSYADIASMQAGGVPTFTQFLNQNAGKLAIGAGAFFALMLLAKAGR
jgi:hypothetical protein